MKSYTSKIILSNKYSLRNKLKLLSLPHIYVADSIKDFQENKVKVRPSFFNYFQGFEDRYYATIVLTRVGLRSVINENGSPIFAENESHEKGYLFEIHDESGIEQVIWPYYPNETSITKKLDEYLGEDTELNRIFLIYDKKYNNAFVSYVSKTSSKSIDDIMKEIWPMTISS